MVGVDRGIDVSPDRLRGWLLALGRQTAELPPEVERRVWRRAVALATAHTARHLAATMPQAVGEARRARQRMAGGGGNMEQPSAHRLDPDLDRRAEALLQTLRDQGVPERHLLAVLDALVDHIEAAVGRLRICDVVNHPTAEAGGLKKPEVDQP
ncbi:MAG: hypothetical protein K6U87_15405 [Firmicutes bacterium]|nr:hypothetical protein [Bacillota bacterium]